MAIHSSYQVVVSALPAESMVNRQFPSSRERNHQNLKQAYVISNISMERTHLSGYHTEAQPGHRLHPRVRSSSKDLRLELCLELHRNRPERFRVNCGIAQLGGKNSS